MTKEQILANMTAIRKTLKDSQAQLIDLMNHILGCEMLMERLTGELDKLNVQEEGASDDPSSDSE